MTQHRQQYDTRCLRCENECPRAAESAFVPLAERLINSAAAAETRPVPPTDRTVYGSIGLVMCRTSHLQPSHRYVITSAFGTDVAGIIAASLIGSPQSGQKIFDREKYPRALCVRMATPTAAPSDDRERNTGQFESLSKTRARQPYNSTAPQLSWACSNATGDCANGLPG